MPRKTKPAQYCDCVVCNTKLHDQVVVGHGLSDTGPPIEWQGPQLDHMEFLGPHIYTSTSTIAAPTLGRKADGTDKSLTIAVSLVT